ncbi:MAG: tetratricopeptide repeat protein [Flavobacteriales bacterium]|nr:tetratricopeptide repeat protein [Flavobacteriales bacterium]
MNIFKNIFRTLALMFFALNISAQSINVNETLFAEGNAAYESGNIEKAIELYEQISLSHTSAALLGNLGNAYFRNGDIARSILNYERSLKLEPGNEDIRFNLGYVQKLTKDKLEEDESDQISAFLRSVTSSYSADTWARSSILFAFMLFSLLALVFILKKVSLKRIFLYSSFIMGTLFLSSIYFSYASKKMMGSQTHAIIIEPKVDVKSEPNKDATDLFVLHEGSKVEILGRNKEWLHIQIPNGTKGWLTIDILEKI